MNLLCDALTIKLLAQCAVNLGYTVLSLACTLTVTWVHVVCMLQNKLWPREDHLLKNLKRNSITFTSEKIAGIAYKSLLWSSFLKCATNEVLYGGVIKMPIIDKKAGIYRKTESNSLMGQCEINIRDSSLFSHWRKLDFMPYSGRLLKLLNTPILGAPLCTYEKNQCVSPVSLQELNNEQSCLFRLGKKIPRYLPKICPSHFNHHPPPHSRRAKIMNSLSNQRFLATLG